MMASESRYKLSDYIILHKFIIPALEQFKECNADTGMPSKKELQAVNDQYHMLSYEEEWTSYDKHSYEEMIGYIDGSEQLGKFYFHDSQVIALAHHGEDVELSLQYGEITAVFYFSKVVQLDASYDPLTAWVYDFSCYPVWGNEKYKVFDLEFIKIIGESIKVKSVISLEQG